MRGGPAAAAHCLSGWRAQEGRRAARWVPSPLPPPTATLGPPGAAGSGGPHTSPRSGPTPPPGALGSGRSHTFQAALHNVGHRAVRLHRLPDQQHPVSVHLPDVRPWRGRGALCGAHSQQSGVGLHELSVEALSPSRPASSSSCTARLLSPSAPGAVHSGSFPRLTSGKSPVPLLQGASGGVCPAQPHQAPLPPVPTQEPHGMALAHSPPPTPGSSQGGPRLCRTVVQGRWRLAPSGDQVRGLRARLAASVLDPPETHPGAMF